MGKQRNSEAETPETIEEELPEHLRPRSARKPAPSDSDAPDSDEARKPAKAAERRFSAASLRSHARQLFGVNPETLEGALYGADASEFTVKEAQAKIKAFLNREVK
jgi:hypothetical protein